MTPSPEIQKSTSPRARVRVDAHELQRLSHGWQAAAAPADTCSTPSELGSLSWRPAQVPGTAAAVLRDAGEWQPGQPHDFDAEEWWFRTSFSATPAQEGEEIVLGLDGIATVAEVFLNGEQVLQSESMFAAHRLQIGSQLQERNELAIRCRALGPLLRLPRRPRARWRTRLVADGGLRFFRTMLLGRAPGFAPGPAAVGPWRGVWLERRRGVLVDSLNLRARLHGEEGRLQIRTRLRTLTGARLTAVEAELSGPSGEYRSQLELVASETGFEAHGELIVPEVEHWWPHTHGEPALYEVRLSLACGGRTVAVKAGRVGFRSLSPGAEEGHDVERDGLHLHVNGIGLFARGAVWTPVDAVALAPTEPALRAALEQVCDAGMNLLRVPGTGVYEEATFYELCDELGVLVWQDFMFANLDYPISDESFHTMVTREARSVLDELSAHPSLAVLCGNSEIEQQVAMLGLDPSLGRGELFGELLPGLVGESDSDAVYVPSAPCGGELPFRPDRGVANYYGVGGYRRPLEDARRAQVRFAAECLAFSNVPDEAAIERMLADIPGGLVVPHPRWKQGVPRDSGSGWDFEDVRDHYLKLLFGVDPGELRRIDHERYLELSRALTGEVMAEVLGEWRRAASPCAGALVLWLRDLAPGAGWGVIDDHGEPKVAYHHLRRALMPVAVWMSDEGLGGVHAHVANDGPQPLSARLRIALYRDFEHRVGEASQPIELAAHGACESDIEALLGHFVDASWAYRFGPPAQDLIVASLEGEGAGNEGVQLLSQAQRFPSGRPLATEPAAHLGLHANARQLEGGDVRLALGTRRFAYGVRLHFPGFHSSDDAFSIEPGAERVVRLLARTKESVFAGGWLTAVNLNGRVAVAAAQQGRESRAAPELSLPIPARGGGGSP